MIDDKRTALLESTVRAVAKYGMKDISTRNISSDAGVNDAYIYRYFENKEDLLVQAYLLENHKFMHHVIRQIDLVRKQMSACPLPERCRLVFHAAWRYLIDTPDVCRFFTYYYHSPNFEKDAQKEYQIQLDELAETILPRFDTMEDAKHCLYALFVLLNSFAILVVNQETPDEADAENRAFNTAFYVIEAEMKKELPEKADRQ